MKNFNIPRSILIPVLLLLVLPSFIRSADLILLPEDVFYHRPAASVASPEAAWVNPAALVHDTSAGLEYLGQFQRHKFLKSWGFVGTGNGLAVAYRHIDNFLGGPYNEYTFAAATNISNGLSWGGSYLYIKEGAGIYYRRHFWNIALQFRHPEALSLAAVFSNINRSRLAGQKSAIEQRYSASYPIMKNQVLISVDLLTVAGEKLADALYSYSLEFIPVRGGMVYTGVDDHENYRVGFRFDQGDYFYGFQSRFNAEAGHVASSIYIGYRPSFSNKGRGR